MLAHARKSIFPAMYYAGTDHGLRRYLVLHELCVDAALREGRVSSVRCFLNL